MYLEVGGGGYACKLTKSLSEDVILAIQAQIAVKQFCITVTLLCDPV